VGVWGFEVRGCRGFKDFGNLRVFGVRSQGLEVRSEGSRFGI
jgi:hypothetical protein